MRLVLRYTGHANKFFISGPNWWQITFPYKRKSFFRIAIIRWWAGD